VTPAASNYSFSPASGFYFGLAANQLQTDFRGFAAATNKPPAVSMSTSGGPFAAPATIACSAIASDSDGTVAKVDFYAGTTLIGTGASAPYGISWKNVAAGTYSLTAVATDNGGATTRSAPVSVTVNAAAVTPAPPLPNQPPTIRLTAPATNATFTAPASVSMVASVADSDGRITRVRFYAGSTLVGSDSNGPSYSMTWRNVPAGTYTLTAVATDDDGARATSAAVTITVKRR
jgi:hypothetical protein